MLQFLDIGMNVLLLLGGLALSQVAPCLGFALACASAAQFTLAIVATAAALGGGLFHLTRPVLS